MTWDPSSLSALENAIRRFTFHTNEGDGTKVHLQVLSECRQFLSRQDDPLDLLIFVDRLGSSSFFSRFAQRSAVSDIGTWLSTRLRREPTVPAQAVQAELGWLRRLVVIELNSRAQRESERSAPRQGGGWQGKPKPPPIDFSRQIAGIKDLRAQAERARHRERRQQQHQAAKELPAAPSALPPAFAVRFADIKQAREVRKAALKRAKAGKPPKPGRKLALEPLDGSLTGLAAGLQCTPETPGVDDVFAALETATGDVRFWVTQHERTGTGLTATAIELKNPTA